MNVLELCSRNSNIGQIIEKMGNRVIRKNKVTMISLVSYDSFIVTLEFINKYHEENEEFFDKMKKQRKPIIIVYDKYTELEENYGFKLLLNKYKINFEVSDCSVLESNNWLYRPNGYNIDEAVSMSSKKFTGYCGVKNTNQYYILNKNNITVMHDPYIYFHEKVLIGLAQMTGMVTMLLNTKSEELVEKVDWLNNIKILDDEKLNEKYNKNKEQIDKLQIENIEIDRSIIKNNDYKSILYTSGDILVNTVKIILEEMLDITIDDNDLKKQDLYMKLDDINILIEVKGVNHPFQRENVSQIERHVRDFAEKNNIYGAEVKEKCKGVLIMNVYSLHELKDKISKEFYSKEVISDIRYENICTMDTLTLLNYYSKWKHNPKEINMKSIILNNNYNEPDYMDIIDIK